MPGVDEREQIWRVQVHPRLTPLASDVDFRMLAERSEASGGDIRNAVLKGAMAAASEPGRDASKEIHQHHLENGMRDVLAAKKVMRQSLFDSDGARAAAPDPARVLEELSRRAWPALVVGTIALVLSIVALILALAR